MPGMGSSERGQISLAQLQARRLRTRFIAGGKNQIEVFARLSVSVERLTKDLKKRYGNRSGKMTRVFGESYIRVVQRFTASNGVPPKQLYRTPEAWLSIIEGFATETSQRPETLLVQTLEDALYGRKDSNDGSAASWLEELLTLAEAMTTRLSNEVDLRPVADYVAGSGLYVEDGEIRVGEWPEDAVGHIEDQPFHAHVLGLVPHVLGLNYIPVARAQMAVSTDAAAEILSFSTVAKDVLAKASSITVTAGIRTVAAITVHADTGLPSFALAECHASHVCLTDDMDHEVATIETWADVRPFAAATTRWLTEVHDASEVAPLPENWMPNSVRFHFPGSSGFERVAKSCIVRPWIWTDIDEAQFWCAGFDEIDEYPVGAPIHTVAAAIESNLLYADAAGRGEDRLDRLLLREMRRISDAVEKFRASHDVRRRSHRQALMSEWSAARPTKT